MSGTKKAIHLQGMLLAPLTVGSCAYISYSGQVIRTSRIVTIHEVSGWRAYFETLNSRYCLDLSPAPISVALPAYMQCAAS